MGSHSRSGSNPPPQVPRHDPFTWTGPATPEPDPTLAPVTTAPVEPAQAPGRVDQFAWSGPAVQAPPAATVAPGWAPAPPGVVAPYAFAPAQRKRRLPVWAIVVISVVGGFFLLMVVAAVAIPVFLNQRAAAVFKATEVSLPASIGGLAPVEDPATEQAMQQAMAQLPACGCLGPAVAKTYADEARGHRVVVVAAKFVRPAHSQDQADFVAGFWQGARQGALMVGTVTEEDPGARGGLLSCAPLNGLQVGTEMCISVDPAAFVMLVHAQPTGSAPDHDFVRTAREAVEQRG